MANDNAPYQLPVVETISASWEKVSGAKSSIWAAIGILVLIMLGLGLVQGIFQAMSPTLGQITGLVFTIIELPLQMGLVYIGITRAFGKPITYRLMFSTFNTSMILRLIGLYLLKMLIFIVPVLLMIATAVLLTTNPPIAYVVGFAAIAAAIYLSIRLYLAIGFLIDQNVGPVTAIQQSFQATRHNVLNLIGLMILQVLIFVVALIPLGIGLIWAIPLGLIIYGTIYKRLSRQ